jgi:acid phosphatase
MEENTGYSSVVGNSQMPFLNGLIAKGGLATNYYANTHPSLPNYLWLTSGDNDGITTDTCSGDGQPVGPVVSQDNIIRHLIAEGISWRTYQEDLNSVGYMGCGPSSVYDPDHNPFRDFTDVQNSAAQQQNMLPFTQFATDLASGHLARFNFISPNVFNDGHSGTLATADLWLQTNIGPLLATPMFQPGGDGLLIIAFDEGDLSDSTHGGGQIAWVVIGPSAKPGYRSTTFYQHQSTLRLLMQGLGLASFPQAAANAPEMTEFFDLNIPTQTPTFTHTPNSTPTVGATPTTTSTARPTIAPSSTPTSKLSPTPTSTPAPTTSGIVLDGAVSSSGSVTSDFVLNMPQSRAGDLCIAQLSWDDGSETTAAAPAGWQVIRVDHVQSWEVSQGLYWHVATAAEQSGYKWTANWTPQVYLGYAGGIACYKGANTVAPIDASVASFVDPGTSVTVPSLTTTSGGDLLILALTGNDANTWTSTPTAYTNSWEQQSCPWCYVDSRLGFMLQPSIGSNGTQTATFGASVALIAAEVALKHQ